MKTILKKIFCDWLGWHDYLFEIYQSPTLPSGIITVIIEHNECKRCGKVERHIEWEWDYEENDFHSKQKGWMLDEPT